MLGWAVNLAYMAALLLSLPLLVYRSWRTGKYRQGWREKFLGELPRRDEDRPLIWIHAVSVGETLLIEPLLKLLAQQRPDCQVLITTTTSTAHDLARNRYPHCRVSYSPFDFTWSVRRSLERVRPDLLVLVELELWPNLIRMTHQRGIPLALVNGRLSRRSERGYRWVKPLMVSSLRCMDRVCVQNEEYRNRFISLGARPERVVVTGSMKFDGVDCDARHPDVLRLAEEVPLAPGEMLWLAGSTHAPEEEVLLQIYRRLGSRFPAWRLMLAPRHAERFDDVARLIQDIGHPVWRRSTGEVQGTSGSTSIDGERPILLLDTLGELSRAWGLADLAFVGGSLTSRGGQNMIEPASYGVATVVGPSTANFRRIVESLVQQEGLVVVQDADDLATTMERLLHDDAGRREIGMRARMFVRQQQGATRRTLEALQSILPRVEPVGPPVPTDQVAQ